MVPSEQCECFLSGRPALQLLRNLHILNLCVSFHFFISTILSFLLMVVKFHQYYNLTNLAANMQIYNPKLGVTK